MRGRSLGVDKLWIALLLILHPVAAEAQSQLIYPRLSFENGTITGLAVVNPSDSDASITFTAYGPDGVPLEGDGFQNPTVHTVGAGEQFSEIVAALFGSVLDESTVGWIEATSPVDDLTGFFLILDGAVSFFDGADLPVASEEIIFQDIRTGNEFLTELQVVNPSTADLAVDLVLAQGERRITRVVEIPGRGLARLDVSELFSDSQSAGEAFSDAYIVASSTEPIAGFSFVRGPGDAFGLNAQPASVQLNRLYFPQLAVLDPFVTELSLINGGQQVALVTITAHQASGDLYGAMSLATNPVVRALGAGEILKENLEELFGFSGEQTLEGWLEVESSSQSVNGSLSYSIPSLNSIAAVASSATGNRRAVFSHIATALGFFTGVAMLNPGTLVANVRVVAVEPDGDVIGTFSTTLRPGERISRLITDLIPDTRGRGGGLIWVSSDTPIYLTSLFGSTRSGVLANIPPQSVPDTYRPDQGPVLTVDPPLAVLSPGGRQKFGVTDAAEGMNWSVNGVPGGGTTVGVIDETGSFLAPASVPMALPVTITAEALNQMAGASVDVISLRTLISGLGVIQSVAYLEGLGRLYVAELGIAPTSNEKSKRTAQVELTLIQEVSSGSPAQITALEDNVSKMVAFEGIDGREYLLLAGRATGRILRLDPLTGGTTEVARGLNRPQAMVLDPFAGSLLVAESDRVTDISEEQLNQNLVVTIRSTDQETVYPAGIFDGIAPRGIAVNGCTGNIFVSDSSTQSIIALDRLTADRRVVLDRLADPGQLLGLFRAGVPCPAAFHLFVVEGNAERVSLTIPSLATAVPWGAASDLLAVAFIPAGSVVDDDPGLAIAGGDGQVQFGTLAELYSLQPINPEVDPVASVCVGVASFEDPNLEAVVRSRLQLVDDPITCASATTVTSLNAGNQNISSLGGAEVLAQLDSFRLFVNAISDLSPLAGLSRLSALNLFNNQVIDLTPVRDLERLVELHLTRNQITDISPLAGLRRLRFLFLDDNEISDLTPLRDLNQLEHLTFSGTQASDLGPLRNLTKLQLLQMANSPVADIGPLTENMGLGEGDEINLQGTLLGVDDCPDIQILVDRGAFLSHDVTCP